MADGDLDRIRQLFRGTPQAADWTTVDWTAPVQVRTSDGQTIFKGTVPPKAARAIWAAMDDGMSAEEAFNYVLSTGLDAMAIEYPRDGFSIHAPPRSVTVEQFGGDNDWARWAEESERR